MKDEFSTAFEWVQQNWLVIALIVSEVAAFLPTKAKGIVQFGLKIGSSLFKTKKVKP